MNWPKLRYNKSQVNKAGGILIQKKPKNDELNWAADVLNNWRSCHAYPMNTFNSTLRDKTKGFSGNVIIAQRLKRISSIVGKLERYKAMDLSRMQDIGGLRAVVKNISDVKKLENKYVNAPRFEHILVDKKDYIESPKDSGYRGIHLIYKYQNRNKTDYNGLLLELQIRTQIQHYWATAVETMGTFLQHSLKSSEGPREWLDYFSLVSAAFSHIEKTAPVPGYEDLSRKDTFESVLRASGKLNVRERLQGFSIAANEISGDGNRSYYYHLVVLDPVNKTVRMKSFARTKLDEANNEYTKIEREILMGHPMQAVLVSAGSVKTLKRAYPNYFLDTRQFISILDQFKLEPRKK